MANLFNWVEIPTSDLERAKTFYRAILGKDGPDLQQADFGEVRYAFLPMEPGYAGGALVYHKNYVPAQGHGVCVYLVVQGDLNDTLARVEAAGGKVVISKMPLGDLSPGYMAQFIDSEGNRLGLWSTE